MQGARPRDREAPAGRLAAPSSDTFARRADSIAATVEGRPHSSLFAGPTSLSSLVPRPTPSHDIRACAIESDRPDGNLSNCVHEREQPLQVVVRDNNVDQALKALKKKLQREGLYREMKKRRAYEKPSERRAREKSEAVRRWRKLQRKRAAREA